MMKCRALVSVVVVCSGVHKCARVLLQLAERVFADDSHCKDSHMHCADTV
jgi:hypothetical protein